jgi:D-lyxose ketol-isomerase
MIISKSFTEIQYKGTIQEIVEASIARKLAPGEKVYLEPVDHHTYQTNETIMKIVVVQTHVNNETPPKE